MTSQSLLKHVLLNNGAKMPRIGLGTYLLQGDKCRELVQQAVQLGYRHIDTADSYENEHDVGAAVRSMERDGIVKRKYLYITTKICRVYQQPNDVKTSLEESLENIKSNYIDLLLIHSPFGLKKFGDGSRKPLKEDGTFHYQAYDLTKTWGAMENAVNEGKVKSIGLSNFSENLIRTILFGAKIKAQNLQFECHVYYQQNRLKRFCDDYQISCTAYGSLGNPGRPNWLTSEENKTCIPLEDATVVNISRKYEITPAQILLRFLIERGIVVIPKASSVTRLEENIGLFDFTLDDGDLSRLKELDRSVRLFPFERYRKHPYFPKENEPF